MFTALEASLIDQIDGAVLGAPIYGSLDIKPRIGEPSAPATLVRVDWGGLRPQQQHPDALLFEHVFAVSVLIAAPRERAADRLVALAGIETLVKRLLAWRPLDEHTPAELVAAGAPEDVDGVWRYTLTLTIPDNRLRADKE